MIIKLGNPTGAPKLNVKKVEEKNKKKTKKVFEPKPKIEEPIVKEDNELDLLLKDIEE